MTSLDAPQQEMHKLTLDTPQKTISNPSIPYVGTIHGGLVPGELIVIHGTVPDDADRFQVDLQCGSSTKPRADVAFHFNPRFKRSGCIVCNTLEREKWGSEEITYEMPFEKGKPFEIVIMILKYKFQVSVNKKHLLLYNHRISLKNIDTLGIYGKVQIKTVEFVSKGELPNGSPLISVYTSGSGMQASHLRDETCTQLTWSIDGVSAHLFLKTYAGRLYADWSKDHTQIEKELKAGNIQIEFVEKGVPHVEKLDTALHPGCTIAIKGEVKKNPKSFAVNLKPSDSKDVALHLNPRMKNKVFVRNSYLHDSWGEEEKEIANFPFSPGMYFEMIILCDTSQFKVAINGVHTLEYKHRFKQLEKINIVEVTGDVHLLEVKSW